MKRIHDFELKSEQHDLQCETLKAIQGLYIVKRLQKYGKKNCFLKSNVTMLSYSNWISNPYICVHRGLKLIQYKNALN